MLRLISFLLLICASLAAGAAPAPKPAVKTAAPRSSSAPALSDAQIENAIKAKLAKSKIGADHFKVRVQGGVAYWEGTTDVIQHKGSATRMAKSAGARAVVNNIAISEAAKQKAASNLATGRRRAQIKRSEDRSEARSVAVKR
ncbi:MAG TPA: BON domain-containing protein [Bryobacteraceae bacterium]|nr:BON domain-containing protein [Bryobacteraceae bacterium]